MADEPREQNRTWAPSPGDALAPPPTPQAPEIPMSKTWPWVAGASVAIRYLLMLVAAIVVIVLLVHWL